MQFVRLTCVISVLAVGLSLEQTGDRRAKKLLFYVMLALLVVKLYLEIKLYSSEMRVKELNNWSKTGSAILLSLHKTLLVF